MKLKNSSPKSRYKVKGVPMKYAVQTTIIHKTAPKQGQFNAIGILMGPSAQ